MREKRSSEDKTNFILAKPYVTTISGRKEKWIEFEFYDQIKDGILFIAFGHSQDKIRLFFGLWSMKIRDNGDCEITISEDIADTFSKYLIEMAICVKENNFKDDNVRTIRFESSDKETKYFREGMSGNVIMIACIDMVQFIIHFDDPREERAYSLAMKPHATIEFANQLTALIDDD